MTKFQKGVDIFPNLWYNIGMKGVDAMRTTEKFIVLDVEGMSGLAPYNVGYIIADRHGKIYKRHSVALPAHIWENIADALRIGQAIDMTKKNVQEILMDANNRKRKRKYQMLSDSEFISLFLKEINRYKVKRIFAYNVKFDKAAISHLFGDRFNELNKIEWCDIISGILPRLLTKKYLEFCLTNGYVTDKGNFQYKAEFVYQYLTNDLNFKEEHTGLADVLIEYFILLSSFKSHKALNFNPICAWRVLKNFAESIGVAA